MAISPLCEALCATSSFSFPPVTTNSILAGASFCVDFLFYFLPLPQWCTCVVHCISSCAFSKMDLLQLQVGSDPTSMRHRCNIFLFYFRCSFFFSLHVFHEKRKTTTYCAGPSLLTSQGFYLNPLCHSQRRAIFSPYNVGPGSITKVP